MHEFLLRLRPYLVVETLNILPALAQAEYLARRGKGPYRVGGKRAGQFVHTHDEPRTHSVDHVVGQVGCNDFSAELMTGHEAIEAWG